MTQTVIQIRDSYQEILDYLAHHKLHRIFLVCDQAYRFLKISRWLEAMEAASELSLVRFDHFQPNPSYESVVEGVRAFHASNSQAIWAIGGGSAMDVAKCIKLYAQMDPQESYLKQRIVPNSIPLMAMPTTAGTGSEATRYAVIYDKGVKQSVSDLSCIPSLAILDPSTLQTLPLYQKKSTMLDALCHAVESFWSVHATEESQAYSRAALRQIRKYAASYFKNEEEGNAGMLLAANVAGKAINLTQTTAGHAMCYKLTSLYGIAHGHAAALCVNALWPWMLEHTARCIDPRGAGYLKQTMQQLAEAVSCTTPQEAADWFRLFLRELDMPVPAASPDELPVLCQAVNPTRLANHPVAMDTETIDRLYRQILSVTEA